MECNSIGVLSGKPILSVDRGNIGCNCPILRLENISVVTTILNIALPGEHQQGVITTVESRINRWLSIQPTFLLWLTMGRYVVKFDESVLPSLSFNDVYIVQESHFRHNPLCAVALPQGIPIVSSICHCDDKYRLENTEWSKSSILLDKTSEDKSQWCIRKAPCTSRDLTLGVCEIYTDPARRSCLLLEHNENDGIWEELEKLVKFEMSIPKLKSLLPTGWMKRYQFDYERMVKGYIEIVLDQIPLYLFNLTIGLFIMYFAKDLADDKGFQVIIQGLIGIFCGPLILFYISQR